MEGERRRVVVTGIGAVCGAGLDAAEVIASAMAGRSAMRHIRRFDAREQTTRIAAEVPLSVDERASAFEAWGMRAAGEAMAAAGKAFNAPERTGVFVGTALGDVARWPGHFASEGPGLASRIGRSIGARGPVRTLTSAFAASADAIGIAAQWIRAGDLDVAIAGGAEAPIVPSVVAGFASMGALSPSNDDPAMAIRPFDRERDGCGLGEGAAFLVLEERERAVRRGATILAEVAGYGATADAFHITSLPDDGEGLVRAMHIALADAGVAPNEVDYINAHGTGTAMNDRVETQVIHTVFGAHAPGLGVSSTKPVTGHLLGAAGAIEAVITIGALRQGRMPPTANWKSRDPACDLDYVPDRPRVVPLRIAMSSSMGFGGHNAVLVFRAHS